MGAPAPSDWVVVLASKEDLRSEAVARCLSGHGKETVLDARMAARRSRGIVLESATRAEAEALVRGLAAEGVEAKAGYAECLSTVPPTVLLSSAAPGPDGLRIRDRGTGEGVVPWGRLRILALGAWPETVQVGTRDVVEGDAGWGAAVSLAGEFAGAAVGLPIGIGHTRQTRSEPVMRTETRRVLDLLLRGPDERLRISTEKFDWSGLGPRMAQTSLANVRALVEELLRFAPDVETNPGMDLLLTGGRLSAEDHETPEDFEREERWLLSVMPE